MPWGHEHDPINSLSIYAGFSSQFFVSFPRKRLLWEKDHCAVFGCNNDRFFPEKYTLKFSFCLKSVRKYLASAPWAFHNTP